MLLQFMEIVMVDSNVLSPHPPAGTTASGFAPGASWGAVFAGAVAAAALSLILLILGTGLGLSSASPWVNRGISAPTFGVSTILWVTFMQFASAGLGGYLAGRLRNRWNGAPSDEVYFRDTAHGFLAWGLATLVTAALLTSTIGSILGTSAKAGVSVAAEAASSAMPVIGEAAKQGDGGGDPLSYFVDSLFRREAAGAGSSDSAPPSANESDARSTAEVTRIFANALGTGTLPPNDAKYVGQLVARRTGLSQADAEKRVTEIFGRAQAKARALEAAAREAADKARKASAYASLWLFVSLLIGAFIASLAATFGGRHRDRF